MNKKTNNKLLGCIADDFTGASDAASFLAKKGVNTLLFNGIPDDSETIQDYEAVVIATKIRSIPAEEAVRDTLKASKWLKQQGAEQIYYKYCSTFDSTPKGNIGPDIDCILDQYSIRYTFLCPSLPVNNRLVKNGVLFVDGKPVAEGHMANHPLNPIWASEIAELMRPQGKYPCMIIDGNLLKKTKDEILSAVNQFGEGKEHFYVIPDYSSDEEGKRIAEVFGDLPFMTGGSGILEHLADRYKNQNECNLKETDSHGVLGRGIALSGSCSTMTCRQCLKYEMKNQAIAVYPSRLMDGTQTVDSIWKQVQEEPDKDFLIYSAGATDPESRRYKDNETFLKASQILERVMAQLGRKAYDAGFTRIICAGGETSSVICMELGFDAFIIGASIAPGVPILTPLHAQHMRLVLKSGNFGEEDFFNKAFEMTKVK